MKNDMFDFFVSTGLMEKLFGKKKTTKAKYKPNKNHNKFNYTSKSIKSKDSSTNKFIK